MVMPSQNTTADALKSSAAADSIDEDLYCLHCGYNLRGLSGNSIRCPECGNLNDRTVIIVPASYIRHELRKMETAPSVCVGASLVALLIATPMLILREPISALVVAAPFGIIWWIAYRRVQSVFNDRLGWRAVIRDFHLATACWVAAIFWLIFLLISLRRTTSNPILYLSYVVVVGLFPLGMYIYRNAQERIDRLQRRKAVATAQEYLQWHSGNRADDRKG